MKVFLEKSKNIDKLSQRLLTLAGFNALFINFSLKLPSNYPSIAICKVIAIAGFLISIFFCLKGILPKDSGDIPTGKILIENLWDDEQATYYVTMVNKLEKAIDQMSETLKLKQKSIENALYLSIIALCLFVGNSLLMLTIQYI